MGSRFDYNRLRVAAIPMQSHTYNNVVMYTIICMCFIVIKYDSKLLQDHLPNPRM